MTSKNPGLVISDNPDLTKFAIDIAVNQNLPIQFAFTRDARTGAAMRSLGAKQVDVKSEEFRNYALAEFKFILSLHCQQIFPSTLFTIIPCFNLHPGLNPHNRGWYPQIFSILNNLPTGATLHRITSLIDGGPVIKQIEVSILASDTSQELYNRIIETEKIILENLLEKLSSSEHEFVEVQISEGNYNSKVDFEKLCELNLNSVGTLKEHINLLRALSHGDFDNAYFLDETGKKISVNIKLRKMNS